MATLEEFGLLLEINDQTRRLVRNMRANAADYIVKANADMNPVVLGATMKADADRFLARLDTVTTAASRNLVLVTAALAIIGVTVIQANALKTTLIGECNHVKNATLSTKQQVIDEANHILSTVPSYDGLF